MQILLGSYCGQLRQGPGAVQGTVTSVHGQGGVLVLGIDMMFVPCIGDCGDIVCDHLDGVNI